MGFTDPELFEGDREIISAVIRQTGLEEDFDSLAAKGTVPISGEPVIQFADLEFPTQSGKIELASAQAEAAGLPRVPRAPLRRSSGKWPAEVAFPRLAMDAEHHLCERQEDHRTSERGNRHPASP